MEAPAEQADGPRQDRKKPLSVFVIPEHVASLVSPGRHVPDRPGVLETERATHGVTIL